MMEDKLAAVAWAGHERVLYSTGLMKRKIYFPAVEHKTKYPKHALNQNMRSRNR